LTPYLKIGFYWGGLGAALLPAAVFLMLDSALVGWMFSNGLLAIYWSSAVVVSAWIAWSTVHWGEQPTNRIVTVALVAVLLTFAYPLLKFWQTGIWLVYTDHLWAFGLHILSFSSVLRLSTLTLGYPNLSDFRHSKTWMRWITHPRFIYTISCIVLDILLLLIQLHLVRLYPVEIGSVSLETPAFGAFSFMQSDSLEMSLIGLAVILFCLQVNAFNRLQLLRIQDLLVWNAGQFDMPQDQRLSLQNTSLVKKAIGLTNVGVVCWHAPESARGIGCDDLKRGATFISSGFIHDAGLASLGGKINLPDFWQAILHPQDFEAVTSAIEKLLSGGKNSFTGTCRFKSQDGSWLSIRSELVVERSAVDALPLALYGIHSNITDEVMLNESLGAVKARQLQALHMIGHDLQGSLGAVMMASSLIERSMKDLPVPFIVKCVDRIKLATNNAIEFLSDAITYAKTEDRANAGEPISLDVNAMLTELVSRNIERYQASPNKVEVSCPPRAVLEGVLEFPLISVLNNLISNAIKYTPDADGKVRITVKYLEAETPDTKGCAVIEVADEGVGIPAAFIEKMFSAFSRASNVGKIDGLGLGLAIVANAVELLDAEISVVSVPKIERGTIFTLSLPNQLIF